MEQEVISDTLIGPVLRDARKAQKLSLEDVCARLHLSSKQVTALEQDDFDGFASAMMARGFIKNYAKLLAVDPEPLLETHRLKFPQDEAQSIKYKSNQVHINPPQFGRYIALFFAVCLILTLLVWLTYEALQRQKTTHPSEAGAHAIASEANNPTDTLPAVEPNVVSSAEHDTDKKVADLAVPKAPASVNEQEPKIEAKKTSDKAVEVATTTEKLKPEPSKVKSLATVRVKLVLTGSSWIEVHDKSDKIVFSKLAKAGTEEYVEGVPPLKFHIGNVSDTQVIFNGATVDLTPSTHNNMAHITLGDVE